MKAFATAMLLLGAAASPAFCQDAARQPPSAEQMKQIMDATFSSVVPFMAKMVEATISTQLDVVSRPESAEKMARYARNLYESLVKQGFSKQEAMEILTHVAMPSAAPPSK